MRTALCILNTLLLTTTLFAQNRKETRNVYGQKYFDRNGDFIIFLSDSVVVTSLNSYGDTAKFQISRDTLFTRQEFGIHDESGYRKAIDTHYYVMSKISLNYILIKAHGSYKRDFNQQLSQKKFFNEETLKEDTKKFELLQIETRGPWYGYKKIQLDGHKMLNIFIDSTKSMTTFIEGKKTTPRMITAKITDKELDTLLKLLQYSQITKVKKASPAILDKTTVDILYKRNKQTYNLYDINIANAQTPLINYLEELEKKYVK